MTNPEASRPAPRIIDATLREGRQAPGVTFGVAESIEIAASLAAIGVDAIECGHPYVGPLEAERVRAVATSVGALPVLAHARAKREDVAAANHAGAQWVGIFIGVNPVSRRTKLQTTRPVGDLISEAVGHAKSQGLKVRFTVEDASRTAWNELVGAYDVALAQGADRLCFADTVGVLLPWEAERIVRKLRHEYPDVPLEVHLHDDRGMSAANALSAIRAGAEWVSASVNGIGERCGITDTVALVANLAALKWRADPDGNALQWVSRLVAAHSRLAPDPWRPVVGRYAFTHTAKLHRDAVARDPNSYAWIDPAQLGRVSEPAESARPLPRARVVNRPRVVEATELRHHGRGPGERYLMLDDRVVPDARQYCIVRRIPALADYGPGHVGTHRHDVDSLLLFLGNGRGLDGLDVEVCLGDEHFAVASPASVFVPAGVDHSYRVVGGSGLFVNHVPAGDYNASLLESPIPRGASEGRPIGGPAAAGPAATNGADAAAVAEPGGDIPVLIEEFFAKRLPGIPFTAESRLEELLDSLAFLDLFLYLEQARSEVSLDRLAACETVRDIIQEFSTTASPRW